MGDMVDSANVKLACVLGLTHRHKFAIGDAEAAYLQSDYRTPVRPVTYLPPGWQTLKGNRTAVVAKSINGLKMSGTNWELKRNLTLEAQGLTQNLRDKSIFQIRKWKIA